MVRGASWVWVAVALCACGGGETSGDAGVPERDARVADDDAGGGDAGPGDGGSQDAGTDDGGVPGPRVVATFDGASFELPESLAYHDGLAYLSFLNGAVVTVDPDGTITPFGRVPIEPAGSGYALGIAVAPDGAVYVATTPASATSTFAPGIYRIDAGGGDATLYATHPELFVPNDVDVGPAGELYVTADGRIYRATSEGTAEIWAEDALLASTDGTSGPCGARTSPFPIGANGIAIDGARVVVGNTETGSVIAIPIAGDGSSGAQSVLAMDDATLCGIDGLARDVDGTFLATVLRSRVIRISADGSTRTTIHEGLPLRTPSGVDVGAFDGPHTAIVANPDFDAAFGAGGPASAEPVLVAIPL